MVDATTCIPEPPEYCFPVPIGAGRLVFLEIITDDFRPVKHSYVHTNPYEA